MLPGDFFNILNNEFGFEPTSGQKRVMQHLSAFVMTQKPQPLYLLKGYAGTGKTSLMGALVCSLSAINRKFVMLAPTGRAAKVMSGYSGFSAQTIHRQIYMRLMTSDGQFTMKLMENRHRNTIFLVDEASMIGETTADQGMFRTQNLLSDLMAYVYGGDACSMILIGDKAQLPPVGVDQSPALDMNFIRSSFTLTAAGFELTEVMRQSLESGILSNATRFRTMLDSDQIELPLFALSGFGDVNKVQPDEFEELLHMAFGRRDVEQAVVVCRSNKTANMFNQSIRSRILGFEEEVNAGDLLMIVKNNYYWLEPGEGGGGFLANGDIIRVNRVNMVEDVYGFRFADAEIALIDYPDSPPLQVKLLLDSLMVNGPSIPFEAFMKLAKAIEEDYAEVPERRKRMSMVRSNPYYNALQVKFSYALTCHKTQGGQWPIVFVEAGIRNKDEVNAGYLRWLYTACTRATQSIYLIGFPEELTD
ncbi:MAG: AAA family ATPase [Bacteroidales bacterium]|nr:AAA family ATPase [Bacteroidales bacterium]